VTLAVTLHRDTTSRVKDQIRGQARTVPVERINREALATFS